MDSRLTVKFRRGGKRQITHGGYSFITKGELPENRTHILKYLIVVRE